MTVDVDKLFEEPGLIQITVWARGVYENKDARDVVVALTEAAKLENKYVQAFENYVDLPDRIYVPVRAYARISPDPIDSKYVYENETPDITAVTEETLVKGVEILEGMRPGGVLVVNTRRSPQEIAKFVKNLTLGKENLKYLATIDASSLAGATLTFYGAEGATDKSGIGVGLGAVIAGAIIKITNIVQFDNALAIVANKDALRAGFNLVNVADAGGECGGVSDGFSCDVAINW